jgi:hypothetical protein
MKHTVTGAGGTRKYSQWAFRKRGALFHLKLAAVCVTALAAGLFAWCAAGSIAPRDAPDAAAQPSAQNGSFNMLVTVRTYEGPPLALTLVRFDGGRGRADILPVPGGLAAGGGRSVQELAARGPRSAVGAVQDALGIKTEYYADFYSDKLGAALAPFGGSFICRVGNDIICAEPGGREYVIKAGENSIDGGKAAAMLCCDRPDRLEVQAGLMRAFICGKLPGYYAAHIDTLLPAALDQSQTNFSRADMLRWAPVLREISSKDGFAHCLVPALDSASGAPRLDARSAELIRETFG